MATMAEEFRSKYLELAEKFEKPNDNGILRSLLEDIEGVDYGFCFREKRDDWEFDGPKINPFSNMDYDVEAWANADFYDPICRHFVYFPDRSWAFTEYWHEKRQCACKTIMPSSKTTMAEQAKLDMGAIVVPEEIAKEVLSKYDYHEGVILAYEETTRMINNEDPFDWTNTVLTFPDKSSCVLDAFERNGKPVVRLHVTAN